MPRTKKRTAKFSSVNDLTRLSAGINQPKNIKQIVEEFNIEKKNIEDYFCDLIENSRNMIENKFLMVKMNLSGSLEKNLYDYIIECKNLDKTPNASTTSTANGFNMPSRTVTKTTANRTTRHTNTTASKMCSTATATKTRSSTRTGNNGPLLTEKEESKYKTPMNRPPIFTSATVTPKVNMNEPMAMMRRPNQGEVALSMTGSPLMVSSVSRDDMATISVPLANGNFLSILPKQGAPMDISFDEQTKNELLLLKGNIEGLLKMNKRI